MWCKQKYPLENNCNKCKQSVKVMNFIYFYKLFLVSFHFQFCVLSLSFAYQFPSTFCCSFCCASFIFLPIFTFFLPFILYSSKYVYNESMTSSFVLISKLTLSSIYVFWDHNLIEKSCILSVIYMNISFMISIKLNTSIFFLILIQNSLLL